MKIASVALLIVTLLAYWPVPVNAACPPGTYPWIDSWGNNVCQRFGGGGAATIEGSLDNCPAGSHPWVDSWGNRVCREFGGGGSSYDTSKGCPVGFLPWIDMWGNSVCKRF